MTIEEKQEREKDEMETWDGNTLTEEVLHQPMRYHVSDAQSGHAGTGCDLDGPRGMKA
jgi:hypothetical protein